MMDWITIFVTAAGALLFLSFVWKNYRLKSSEGKNKYSGTDSQSADLSICKSPTCVRCQSRAYDAYSVKDQLVKSFMTYAVGWETSNKVNTWQPAENSSIKTLSRVLQTINSIDNTQEILKATYHESGYKFEPSNQSQPHIWWMPGLKRSPFWEASEHSGLEKIATVFESSTIIEVLQHEYKNACSRRSLWKENKIPNGAWKLFCFYDQGSKLVANCDICPHTTRLLESINDFMIGCVYGNAMISVLEPGSQIEAHTGPCNFRLRCHLALFENKNYMVQVGTEVRSWEKGKLMVFDDSYVHRVWHERSSGDSTDERVVLIFDVWHPDVSLCEQQSLSYLFAH